MNEESHELLKQLRVGWISDDAFVTVRANAVIATVDFVLARASEVPEAKTQFMLIKRRGDHWPDVWWFLGGMQKRGETESEALLRLIGQETGLSKHDINRIDFVGNVDVFNPGSGPGANKAFIAHHSKMAVHVINIMSGRSITLDGKSENPTWFTKSNYPQDLPDPVQESLRLCGLI